MANLFFISDTHFGHANILTFKDESGALIRPGFKDVNHMDEVMIQRWNETVRPQDHVYHLGDVAMSRKLLPVARRLNGHKRLIFGNHDIYDWKEYVEAGFEKLMGMRVMHGIILTHVPVHPESLGRFKINVHGHIHQRAVMLDTQHGSHEDKRYLNISVERIDYRPVSLDWIREQIKQ